ncbi:two-component regulator propeller domain-containing protein [Carboxylicivirga marina]|uniref:two-component regulator propeller domain-containing protein n=1 Tax=Carboxylicivirga marina TaxID=2800988 RepID=UPI0025953DA5|nr:two-component regulator propeller domain-containing protein [uncultured Carboxylicivirga sp.]
MDKRKNISGIYALVIFLLLLSCNHPNKSGKDRAKTIKDHQSIANGLEKPYTDSSLINIPNGNIVTLPKKVSIANSIIRSDRLNPKKLKEPKSIPVNLAQVKRNCSGVNNFELPLKFSIPDTGFLLQNGDTIFAPRRITDIRASSVKALPFKYSDNAALNMKNLDVEQGLTSSYILSMITDKRGNLWLGTNGGGVCRYNGETFTIYNKKNGLPSNHVRSILQDKKGNIWFGFYGDGVCVFNGKDFIQYDIKQGLAGTYVCEIIEDKNGRIWIATDNAGISCFDGKSFVNYTEKQGLVCNDTKCIAEDNNGDLWIGTKEGLSHFDGKTFTSIGKKEGLSSDYIWTILVDDKNKLWFGTVLGGVSCYDGKVFKSYTDKHGLPNNDVYALCQDKAGNIWIGTYGGGVMKLLIDDSLNEANYYINYSEIDGLRDNYVRKIVEDISGNIWLGLDGGGVCCFNEYSFTNYREKEGLTDDVIMAMCEDRKRNLWFGTYGSELIKYNGNTFEKVKIAGSAIKSIYEDDDGIIWIGTGDDGVFQYNGTAYRNFTKENGFPSDQIMSITQDSKGNMWFGTYAKGVFYYDGTQVISYGEEQGLQAKNIISMLEDKHGNLWLGTNEKGAIRFNGKEFAVHSQGEGLAGNYVSTIMEDNNGNLWFGTYDNGLSFYDGNTFSTIDEECGLSNNRVYTIIEDNEKNIWVSTENGLNCIVFDGEAGEAAPTTISSHTKETKTPTKNLNNYLVEGAKIRQYKIVDFGVRDGLKVSDFFRTSGCIDSQNRIWWGSGKALVMLDRNKFYLPAGSPKIQFEGIDLMGEKLNFDWSMSEATCKKHKGIRFTSMADFHHYPLGLSLPYHLDHLVFKFSAIDWSASHKIQYQYQLEGLDKEWNLLTSENKAEYRNIPHGFYTFKVRAKGAAEKWSEVIEYKFTIRPPLWLRWWAYIVYLILCILAVWLIVKIYTRRLIKQKRVLENTVKDRTKEIATKNKILEESNVEIFQQKERIIEQKEEIEASFKNVKMLSEMGLEITSSLEMDEIIEKVYLNIYALMDVSFFSIGILNQQTGLLEFKTPKNCANATSTHKVDITKSHCFAATCFNASKEVVIQDFHMNGHTCLFDGTGAKCGEFSKSIVYIPLIAGDKKIGVISIQGSKKNTYTQNQINILKNLAIFVATAIENAVSFEKIEDQNNKLISLNRFKQLMTDTIVHDLKNPLNIIINGSENNIPFFQQRLRQTGQHMLNMVTNILDVHKYKEESLQINASSHQLLAIANHAIVQVEYLADQKHIELKNNINDRAYALVDSDLMERVFVNILVNAIKYTPVNGIVALRNEHVEGDSGSMNALGNKAFNHKVFITDSGPGIPEDQIHKVFDAYMQIDAKKSGSARSTGIGLTFCKIAIEAHGGKIGVDSEAGKGASFWFTINAADWLISPEKPMADLKRYNVIAGRLTKAEKMKLKPYTTSLRSLMVYENSEIEKILNDINIDESENIRDWKEEMKEVLFTLNEKKYAQLIDIKY